MFSRLCRETNIADMTSPQEDENPAEFQQEFFEDDGIFAQDILINQSLLDQVSKTSLTLSPDEVFKSLSTISKLLRVLHMPYIGRKKSKQTIT